ncbi:gibberellin-regulated protein 14 [Cucumis sativus]|uniref:Uncharacterized protein n=1 Tax=Cucumis sativus TaxID=3659 RepID=A0A0A0L8G8_CUCSA|nr:gibberellin-regulated protein 14 [Cucumis sativus]KGN56396.1 hypothetical protein Csa_011358 [Cucumis sativus]
MANLPRYGRRWRLSTVSRLAPTATQSVQEPEPEILPLAPTIQTLQPFEPTPPAAAAPPSSTPGEPTPRISPPAASPKYEATVIREASPPLKPARSPPVSPPRKSVDPRHSISPNSYQEPLKPTRPSLSTLALPKSADVTTVPSAIKPEVEQKTDSFKKSDRQVDNVSAKPPPSLQAKAINLTGDNIGAVMKINQFSDKISGGEVTRKIETKTGVQQENDMEKSRRETEFPMTPITNSNFQEVNNSVMYNSSCSGRDPGLHLDFSGQKDEAATVDGNKKSKY